MTKTIMASVGMAALAAALLASGAANATEGYFLGGYGVNQTALSGAGVANSEDAMAMSLNPAGIVGLGQEITGGAELFLPSRGYTASNGTFLTAPGAHDSGTPYFILPNVAYVAPMDTDSSWGVALYGNGGNSTDYPTGPAAFCNGMPGAAGTFCAGHTGVNLMQLYLQGDYAKRIGNITVGVSPVLAMQTFYANGLGAFGAFGLSASPANLTNNGTDYSFGAGLHAGIEWRVTPGFRIGLSGATETYMSKFSKYSGLFANQGSFDIPAWFDVGAAFDVNPAFTIMADYKRIFYSSIPAVGDSSLGLLTGSQMGSTNGPGFGWSDMNVLALGATFKASPELTLRAGAEFNNNPAHAADVMISILAPGVTTSQFSAGLTYKASSKVSIDFSGYYDPNVTLSGSEIVPGFGVNTGGAITTHLNEVGLLAGLTYHFDGK